MRFTMKRVVSFIFAICFCTTVFADVFYIDESEIPELRYLNTSADPCHNFYEYTCGNFKNVKPRPEDEHIWDHFTILQKEVHSTVKAILETKRSKNEPKSIQKAKAFYRACIDTEYIDQLYLNEAQLVKDLGGWPLIGTEDSQNSNAIISWEKIGKIVSDFGVSLFFDIQVGPNLYNGSENAIWIFHDTMPNPSTIIYRFEKHYEKHLDLGHELNKQRSKGQEPTPFMKFVQKLARKVKNVLGTYKTDEEIFEDIEELLEFIKLQYAGGMIDNNVNYLSATPTLQELQEWTNQEFGPNVMNWFSYLNEVFSKSGVKVTKEMRMMIQSPSYLYGVINMIQNTKPSLIQNFILTRIFTYTAPDSHKTMREAFNTYYKEQNWPVYPRQEYCLRKTMGMQNNIDFSMALTFAYQRYFFNINKLEKAAEMISDLQSAFKDILNNAEWMDDGTKQKCYKKVENMVTLLGYPEFADDHDLLDEFYENIRVCTWDHFGNSQRMRSFRLALKLRDIENPRDRAIWQNSPLDVNAFYNRPNNRIVFPIGILDPVFFTGYISALDYGRIGAIIGHEITHGFDNKGRTYDQLGQIGNIWNEETMFAFEEKSQCFKEQYSKFYIEEIQKYVNGTTTLDENLADNGGLRESYMAFERLKNRKEDIATVIGFTPDQLFFVGFGTMWCMQESDYYLESLHTTGTYSPGRFRVNGAVSNNEYFAKAFNCPLNSQMNPEDKCVLW